MEEIKQKAKYLFNRFYLENLHVSVVAAKARAIVVCEEIIAIPELSEGTMEWYRKVISEIEKL